MLNTLVRTLAPAALLAAASTANAGTLYVDDFQNVYSYTEGGTRTTFSSNTGGTILSMAATSSGTLYGAARDPMRSTNGHPTAPAPLSPPSTRLKAW